MQEHLIAICTLLVYLLAMAFWFRCRGSQFLDVLDILGTGINRCLACLCQGVSTGYLALLRGYNVIVSAEAGAFIWVTVWLAVMEAWDNYWGAAIGSTFDPNKSTVKAVDWILKKIPYFKPVYLGTSSTHLNRLWGLTALTLRDSLLSLSGIGLAVLIHQPEHALYALGFASCGLAYYLWGYIVGTAWAVPYAEYTVGLIQGLIYSTILRQYND